MDSRWARVARGLTAAGFATFVAAFSHALAGGPSPTVFAVLVSLVISGMACTLLTGRRLSAWRLTVSVAVSQALFHGLFSSLGTPVAAAHDHSVVLDAAHGHATMWGAHAVAAVVTIVAFRYAEVAFWGVAETARLLFARFVGRVIPTVLPPRIAQAERPFVVPQSRTLLPSMSRRGPPVLSF